MESNEKTKNLDAKVLGFGFCCLLLVLFAICGALVLFLYQVTAQLNQERSQLVEQQSVISDLRKALYRAEGRIEVYDDFLVGTRASTVRRMVRRFLRQKKVRSDNVTLLDFEQWAISNYRVSTGLGGS